MLSSVVIFGWPAMLEILVHEGVFDGECTADGSATTSGSDDEAAAAAACPAQLSRLNLIFVVASSLTLGCSITNGECNSIKTLGG